MMKAIEVHNLKRSFNGLRAVDGISFEVERERFLVSWVQTEPVRLPPSAYSPGNCCLLKERLKWPVATL